MSSPPGVAFSETDLYLAFRHLCRVVDLLSDRVNHLERQLASPTGGWFLLTEEGIPLPTGIPPSRFWELEEGPPTAPPDIIRLCANVHAPPGPWNRCYRAWEGGFWCGIALRTRATFYPLNPIDVPDRYWVVWRAPGINRPFAVESQSEVDRILAVPGPSDLAPIVVGFPSIAELQVFCAGGALVYPAFYKWRNP